MVVTRVEKTIERDGVLTLENLPLRAGDRVEVVVSSPPRVGGGLFSDADVERSRQVREQMRGTILRYDDPFGPAVPLYDWEVFQDDAADPGKP